MTDKEEIALARKGRMVGLVIAGTMLLWIAAQALNANLPPGWTEHEECVSDNFQLTGRLS